MDLDVAVPGARGLPGAGDMGPLTALTFPVIIKPPSVEVAVAKLVTCLACKRQASLASAKGNAKRWATKEKVRLMKRLGD